MSQKRTNKKSPLKAQIAINLQFGSAFQKETWEKTIYAFLALMKMHMKARNKNNDLEYKINTTCSKKDNQ